ncbi:MAG: gliding motility-associated C-terminal domain-containing protein [Flavobacteriales bacterium]|nr:gliding motility-associated C-terminal domain-containing protein [Flavobacteriales bacterium]MCB9448878.1 gliding motility-associated C-terminal domain-containing protein [Flavobacteriales bacterium]
MKQWIQIALCLLVMPLASTAQTQEAVLHCISVNASGSATLTWTAPTDTCSGFDRYDVYGAAAQTGPYSLLAQINDPVQLSYTDGGANAQNGSRFYYVQTVSACGSFLSDTLSSMYLKLSNTGGSIAGLSWNEVRVPLPVTAVLPYRIYREYPPGNWMLVGTSSSPSFKDTISICNAQVNYRVELSDNSGCISVSSVDGDVFKDVSSPSIRQLDSVSVDTLTGNPILGWIGSTEKDAAGYLIYQFKDGYWQPVDTIWSADSTFYMLNDTTSGSTRFRIAAFDSCFNVSPFGDEHRTMYLSATYDPCARTALLEWNPYISWKDSVSRYDLYVMADGGAASFLASVTGTQYLDTGLTAYSNYCYLVRAVSGTGTKTSTSNKACVTANSPLQPMFGYVTTASVNGSQVDVRFYVDTAASVQAYRVLRSDSPGGTYTTVATLPVTTSPLMTYSDADVDVASERYAYKLEVIDSCGMSALTSSNYGYPILCSVVSDYNFTNMVSWTAYEDWPSGVVTYGIYRSDAFNVIPVLVATVAGGTYSYADDVSALYTGDGAFCYTIVAQPAAGYPWPVADSSMSNTVCAYQLPRLFIPNAFTPNNDQVNDVFSPVSIFIDPLEYSFIALNRWGFVVYETDDPKAGWDGTYKGHDQPVGVYVYYVRIKTVDGRAFEKRGTFNLIR